MNRPVVLVSGLGRCGSSLVMQMLEAAGVPTTGEYPGFEAPEANHRAIDAVWLRSKAGHAIKWLDPHLTPLPNDAQAVSIWLDRDFDEQASSQAKFACLLVGVPKPTRQHRRAWAAGLRRDRDLAMREVLKTRQCLSLSFERLIHQPLATAKAIAEFLSPWFGALDVARMASVVIPRSITCEPGLDIEVRLVESREGAA